MKNRIEKILEVLNQNLYEREETIKLAFLTAIAGESIFLLGPPGVAKSLISRRIKEVFKNGKSFEYLMNRFSTPDDIFGPIDILKLKQDGSYERKIENYLAGAEVVFLDEIWKASSSIQNSLLTVINEKIYRNGDKEINVPMKVLISASNELPAKDEGLEALWDRFIVRCLVTNIEDKSNFDTYIQNSNCIEIKLDAKLKITKNELKEWNTKIKKTIVPNEVVNVINAIKFYLEKYNKKKTTINKIYISDRRWKKTIHLLKTSAFLNERKQVDLMDCFLIAHTIWNEPEQIEFTKEIVIDAIEKHAHTKKYSVNTYDKEIADLKKDILKQVKIFGGFKAVHSSVIKTWTQKIRVLTKDIDSSLKDLNNYINVEIKKIENNLFIPASLSEIIENGIEETKSRIMESRVKVTNLKKEYYAK